MASHEGHKEFASSRLMVAVWIWLLVLTLVEILLAYNHLPLRLMFLLLMGLSVTKAGLIMAYFMHLRFERMNLVLTLIPALVVVISLFAIFVPDSVRLLQYRVH